MFQHRSKHIQNTQQELPEVHRYPHKIPKVAQMLSLKTSMKTLMKALLAHPRRHVSSPAFPFSITMHIIAIARRSQRTAQSYIIIEMHVHNTNYILQITEQINSNNSNGTNRNKNFVHLDGEKEFLFILRRVQSVCSRCGLKLVSNETKVMGRRLKENKNSEKQKVILH